MLQHAYDGLHQCLVKRTVQSTLGKLPRLQELASLQCLVERTSSVQSGPFWESLLQSKSFVILQLHPCDTKVPYTLGTRPKHAGDSCECLRPKAQIPYLSRLGPIGRT